MSHRDECPDFLLPIFVLFIGFLILFSAHVGAAIGSGMDPIAWLR